MDVEKFQSLLESEYESLHDIYIKNDYVEDDDICDCGYTGDGEHECIGDDEDDIIFEEDEDMPIRLTAHSVADDMLIFERNYHMIQNIRLDQNRPAASYSTVISFEWKYTDLVEPLLENDWWHQRSPFNDRCPEGCPAGCVVIATAHIMAYNQIPAQPTFGGMKCDWELMKTEPNVDENGNIIKTPETEKQFPQLAAMCYELGRSNNCNVDYSSNGSSALATGAKKTLQNYGFRNVTKRTGFGSKNQNRAANSILAGKPVYLGAQGKEFSAKTKQWTAAGMRSYSTDMSNAIMNA